MVITGYFKFIQIQSRNTKSFHLKVSIKVLLKIHTVNPLLRWGGGGGLFNLQMMMVSVRHKELEYKAESSSTRRFRSGSQGSESNLNFHLVNKPPWTSRHKVLWPRLINTVYH